MIKIEKAKLEDAKKIAEMKYEEYKFHNKYDRFYAPSKNCKEELLKDIKAKIKDKNCIVLKAIDRNKIVGMLIGTIEHYPKTNKNRKSAYIEQIYVDKTYRKKRIGTQLVKKSFDYFKSKNLKYIEVEAHPTNKNGLKFWSINGFKNTLLRMRRKL